MKALLFVCMLASASSAETYKLGDGVVVKHEHRCASPKAKARLTDFVAKDPKVTIGHDQMTVTTDTAWGADRVVVNYSEHTGFWNAKPDSNGASILMEVVIDTYGEPKSADGNKHQPVATIRIAQTYDGATCVEEWRGNAELVR